MKGERLPRVQEAIKRELSELLRENVKDSRVSGIISITEVKVSKDLGSARVYFSLLSNSPEEEERVLQGLNSAAGYLRGEVARRLNLRKAPQFRFFPDHTIERAVRVSALIEEALIRDKKDHQHDS